jgi:BirA family biotin operon repressor/biotin-[acetyl-CoA-carboxylase] ligase
LIIGNPLLRYQTLDSTSDEARRLIAAGAGEGLVVVAATQIRGRGKPGSAWFSPPGNLYLSAVVKPYRNPGALSPVTLVGALAARAVIGRLAGLPVVIKWPNDLLIRGKKAGGVLTERLGTGHLIVGIGLNINNGPDAFPAELKGSATSLRIEAGREFPLSDAATLLIAELDREYQNFLECS